MKPDKKNIAVSNKIIIDKGVLNCYYQINIDSIPGGESPPRRPSECRPRVTQLGAFFRSKANSLVGQTSTSARDVHVPPGQRPAWRPAADLEVCPANKNPNQLIAPKEAL